MRNSVRRSVFVAVIASLIMAFGAVAFAQETPEQISEQPADSVEVNTLGLEVYTEVCSACHQPDGRGIGSAFPPLVGNPNVDDADYVAGVIAGGRQGEIIVGGVTFNSVMPAFSTLTDEEVAAVIAYVQNDLGQPTAAQQPTASAGPVAGAELPAGASAVWKIGIWIGILSVIGFAIPTVMAQPDGASLTWNSAWIRAGVIVAYFAIATVWLPSEIIEFGPVSRAPRIVQDLLASGVWFVALAAGVFGLRRAQKDQRI